MRIALRLAHNAQAVALRRMLEIVAENHDVDLVDFDLLCGRSFDLIIVQQLCLEDANSDGVGRLLTEVQSFGVPYILVERLDGANITGITRRLLCSDCPPAKVFKTSKYADPWLWNRYNGRYQEKLIAEAFGVPFEEPRWPKQVPIDRLERISVPFNFGAYEHCQRILQYGDERAANTDRPIDVSFAGTVSYSGGLIERHRQACIESLQRVAVKTPLAVSAASGRPLGQVEYDDLLFNSKCVVSPCGWGEIAWRDWEAIFAGCQLIKPCAEHLAGFPSHFACKPDFSDLAEVVGQAVRGLDQHHDATDHFRRMQVHDCSPASVASRLWAEIEQAVQS